MTLTASRRRGIIGRATAITAVALLGTALIAPAASAATPAAGSPAAASDTAALHTLVNPFVGVDNEGNAYPGATMPFGMVQLSPDNINNYGNTSYTKNVNSVWGFSHRHVNSAGCPAAGEVLVTPSVSATPITSRSSVSFVDRANTEKAEAGYYTAELKGNADGNVKVELTATDRVGVHRYTFPSGTTSNLSFNVGQTLNKTSASSVTWTDAQTLEGWVDSSGFCPSTDTTRLYFSAHFDRAPIDRGTWAGGSAAYTPDKLSSEVTGGNNGAVGVFDTTSDHTVDVAVGISYVSTDGARANRVAEVDKPSGALDFDAVHAQAAAAWDKELGRIDVTTQTTEAAQKFYTQLYKTLISPTIGSDVDGQYRGADGKVHQADGWTYYQTFSLWDTYRTQATLQALVEPDRTSQIVRSMYQYRVEGGWLPRWSLGPVETNVMAGDPVSAWLAENYAMGTVPADISDKLWGYLIENATTSPPAGSKSLGRITAEYYNENHHVPFYPENGGGLGGQYEEYRHGGSASMEFAHSDAAIGAAAARLGKTDTAREFLERGTWWRRLWNPDVKLTGGFTGMVNAVKPDGTFDVNDGTGEVQQTGFHEGTPWQYQWMANQDIAGMITLMGGPDEFTKRLDYYFDMDALRAKPGVAPARWAPGGSSYYSSIGYNPGNEPTIEDPWIYNAIGQPAKVNDVLAANLNLFDLRSDGGVGNDDLGTLSAWYVMASLGFQPAVPGSGMLAVNAPRVQAATIHLPDGKTIRINARGADESMPRYVKGLTVDGKDHPANWFDVTDIQDGGTLNFDLAASPDGLTWGTAVADRMPSVSDPLTIDPPTLTPATTVKARAGAATTLDVGTVAFGKDATDTSVKAEISFGGGKAIPLTTRQQGNHTVLSLETTFTTPGTQTGTITVSSGANTPKFAPEPFAPVTGQVAVQVTDRSAPTVTLSTKTAKVGDQLTVSGAGFAAGEQISVVLHSDAIDLGTALTDAAGNFTLGIVVPDVAAGTHQVVVTGSTSGALPGVDLRITGSGTPVPAASPTGTGKLLPWTGSNVAPWWLVGAGVLIVAGAAFAVFARRRAASGAAGRHSAGS